MRHLLADLPVDRLIHVNQRQAAERPQRKKGRCEQQARQPKPLPVFWGYGICSCLMRLDRRLSRRPAQRATAEQVQMQVVHRLAAVRPGVDHDAKTGFIKAQRSGDMDCRRHKLA